jgi:hypothetical protein
MVGRVGFYFFFKHAGAAGVPLWIYTSGATETILALPLFFYYLLPDGWVRRRFGLFWGSRAWKAVIGLTGWVVYFRGVWPVLF